MNGWKYYMIGITKIHLIMNKNALIDMLTSLSITQTGESEVTDKRIAWIFPMD